MTVIDSLPPWPSKCGTVVIRLIARGDASSLADLDTNASVRKYMPVLSKSWKKMFDGYVDIENAAISGNSSFLVVADAATNAVIGRCDLHWLGVPEHEKEFTADLTIVLATSGRGIGRVVARVLIEHAFSVGAVAVTSETSRNNAAARKLMHSLGFHECQGDSHYAWPGRSAFYRLERPS